jgi:hypothetical protein
LRDLPEPLRREFRESLDLGNLSAIEKCLEDIREIDARLAKAVEAPLAQFAFGSLLERLGETVEESVT